MAAGIAERKRGIATTVEKKQRLFAAIDPPDSARQHLASAVADAGLPNRLLRLADPEQWHITVAFYGEVGEQMVTELTERLERAAGRTPAMTLAITGAGTFPANAAQGRVLWTGVTGDSELLVRLADRARAAGSGRSGAQSRRAAARGRSSDRSLEHLTFRPMRFQRQPCCRRRASRRPEPRHVRRPVARRRPRPRRCR